MSSSLSMERIWSRSGASSSTSITGPLACSGRCRLERSSHPRPLVAQQGSSSGAQANINGTGMPPTAPTSSIAPAGGVLGLRVPTSKFAAPTTAPTPAAQHESSGTGRYPWLRQWYPVCAVADVAGLDKPQQVSLFGLDLVVWLSRQGGASSVSAFQNLCPHRMAPLSEGVIRGDQIECSYHGWRFDGAGRCCHIPQAEVGHRQDTATSSPRACVRSYPAKVEAGLVWVWPDASPEGLAASKAAAPNVPADVAAAVAGATEAAEAGVMNTSGGWLTRDLPYSFDVAIENVMDPAHALFSHHGYLGQRSNAIPFGMKLKGSMTLEGGLELDLGSHSATLESEARSLEFRPPCLTKNLLTVKGGTLVAICGYFVPTCPGWTRVISTAWSSDMGPLARGLLSAVPVALLHAYTNAIFDGDLVLIYKQEQNLAEAGGDWSHGFFMPTPSDAGVVAFRRWWDLAGGTRGLPWQKGMGGAAAAQDSSSAATTVDPRQLLDRLNQHTVHCAACRSTLQRLQRAQAGAVGLAVALAVTAAGGLHPPLLAGLAGASALAALACSRLKEELIYRPYEHH